MTSQLLLSEIKKRDANPNTGQFLIPPSSPMKIPQIGNNVNLYENLVFKFRLFSTFFQKEMAVPVDSEAVSKCRKTTQRVTSNLDNCNFRNEQVDKFNVGHFPSKLNSYSV